MSAVAYPETEPTLEHPSTYPGTVYRHNSTGKLIGIVSCDKHHWVEIVNASARRYQLPLQGFHKHFSKAAETNLEVLSRIEDDHGGEWPTSRETWRVAQTALVYKLGEVRA